MRIPWILPLLFALSAVVPAQERDRYVQAWLDTYQTSARKLERLDFEALRRAIRDLTAAFPKQYVKGPEYLARLETYEKRQPQILEALKKRQAAALDEIDEILAFQREALLSNPLLDFDELLVVRRKPAGDPRRSDAPGHGLGEFLGLPRQSSWQIHAIPQVFGWDNEIAVLSSLRGKVQRRTLFQPSRRRLVSDVDLHWDADRLLFSMPDDRRLWHVWEIDAAGRKLRQVTPGDQPDVHYYDAVYLPNGKINFISTAVMQGVPCNAGLTVGSMYQMDQAGKIRQLCFDQDHSYNPTVMNDGRVLYLRWEYTDVPHVWARYLFSMNPDGTDQRAYYGSGSYWPNSIFYSRPIPGHPSQVVGVITGHHVGRVGELVLFDPARARSGADGAVQKIPGYGKKVEPPIQDKLTINTYPKFLHPYPLSEKYFLVAAKPAPEDLWGIYLVDVFDNMTLILEEEGQAFLEPIPLRRTPKPPVIPDRIDLARDDGLVYISDIYGGPGLKGVPRGAVKNLRLFTYHFGYNYLAGINHRVGADGPWEPKQVLGTVPVEPDGSVFFRVPARTPVSIQPLDENGMALQLMRSWLTAMPGEFVSCNGCHESQSLAAVNRNTAAIRRGPSEIHPWRGPVRGFSFRREVQPVLDRFCVSCHDGSRPGAADLRAEQGKWIAYKNGDPVAKILTGPITEELHKKYGGIFDPSYIELRRYTRVGGLESDLRGLHPGEFRANTTELFQILQKGHYGVTLDAEAWDRLATWVDLNAPCHGTWRETAGVDRTNPYHTRRRELQLLYAGFVRPDPEVIPEMPRSLGAPVPPKPVPVVSYTPKNAFRVFEASAGSQTRTLDLGGGVTLELVRIPAGEFVMGDATGHLDEQPPAAVRIERPFWIGKFEVTNEQYARFDPAHDSRYEDKGSWMFNEWDLGWALNTPRQPVIRVSQKEALAFCRWLSEKTGHRVTLPTEAQWEYACRAGTATPLSYGDVDTDFSKHANLADWTIRDLVYDVRDQYPPDLVPRDARFNDGKLVTAAVGSYQPNPWGLYDMHGNVWEWTRSAYRPYPYRELDGRNQPAEDEAVVARGGSWYDRPKRSRSSYRLSYPAWQKVYNVGLRVVLE
jgi:formylglycine-generating enzyme required for sulfatase activity